MEGRPERAELVITELTQKGIRRPKLLHALSVAKLQQGKAKEAPKVTEKKLGKKAKIQFEPIQLGDVKIAYAKIEKAKDMLGFYPRTNFDEGISKFIDWYLSYHEKVI